MQDDDQKRLPRSGSVDLSNAAERARWAKLFRVEEAVLVQAVRLVGPSVTELRKLFIRD